MQRTKQSVSQTSKSIRTPTACGVGQSAGGCGGLGAAAPAAWVDDVWQVAMRNPRVHWADVMEALDAGLPPPAPSDTSPAEEHERRCLRDEARRAEGAAAAAAAREAAEAAWEAEEAAREAAQEAAADVAWADFEAQPFFPHMETIMCETAWTTAKMSNKEFQSLMRWTHARGWDVEEIEEDIYGIFPFPQHAPVTWKPAGCPIPRFCREASCANRSCRYEHGDTIHRLNEPCKFGAGCGSGDAAKRAQCLRMHPGEVWTAEMAIHRC